MIYYRVAGSAVVGRRARARARVPFFKQTVVINDRENEIQHTENLATDLLPCT